MNTVGHIGFAALAAAVVLAFTAGATAAFPVPNRIEARSDIVTVHGCHIGCVKTGPLSAHRHHFRTCVRLPCGRNTPSPPPPRR